MRDWIVLWRVVGLGRCRSGLTVKVDLACPYSSLDFQLVKGKVCKMAAGHAVELVERRIDRKRPRFGGAFGVKGDYGGSP